MGFSNDKLLELYKLGWNDHQIGKEMGYNHNTIYNHRKQLGLTANLVKERQILWPKIQELYDKGYRDYEIAKELNISSEICSYYRKKFGLKNHFIHLSDQEVIDAIDRNGSFKKAEKELGRDIKQRAKKLGIVSKYSLRAQKNKENKLKKPKYVNPKTIIKDVTREEEQLILGGLLGDMCLHKNKVRKDRDNASPEGTILHSRKQKEYCLWKYEKMKRFCKEPKDIETFSKQTGKIYYQTKFRITTHDCLDPYYKLFYTNNHKKEIPLDIIDRLDPLGLAVWYMDDGTYKQHHFSIATNCFRKKDLDKICVDMYNKWGLTCKTTKDNKKAAERGWKIYIGAKNYQRFKDLIKPYIVPTMLYKIGE